MIVRRPPFPGMDPWLEGPGLWPDLHNSLVGSIRDALVPEVDPRYVVSVEERVVFWSPDGPSAVAVADIAARPSGESPRRDPIGMAEAPGVRVLYVTTPIVVPVVETFLEVRDLGGREVVTVIEVLSPANKRHARGRKDYLKKRNRLLESRTNLVEIDLLRAGKPMPLEPRPPRDDYRILVSPASRRPGARLYLFSCRVPVPDVEVPLRDDEAAPLRLNTALHQTIERARYFRRIDYHKPPVPPLRPADADWAAAIVRQAMETS